MSVHVRGSNIGEAWLASFEALNEHRWDLVNLTVTIDDPCVEDLGVRRALELELARRLRAGVQPAPQSLHTVANTIFPLSLYVPGRGDAAQRFFDAAIAGQRSRHGASARWGTYIGRFLDYPGPKGRANQLELVLAQLRSEGAQWKDRYELAVSIPAEDGPPDPNDEWQDIAGTATSNGSLSRNTRPVQRLGSGAERQAARSLTDLRVISDP